MANTTIINQSDRNFILQGDKKLSPGGSLSIASQEAVYLMNLYPDELVAAANDNSAPAADGKPDYEKMNVEQLKEALKAANIEAPEGAKKAELVKLAHTIDAKTEAAA